MLLNTSFIVPKAKLLAGSTFCLLNGFLYFVLSRAGGANLQSVFKMEGKTADEVIGVISGGAGLCYMMFTCKTLEFLNLHAETKQQKILSVLAPFSASAFLVGGKVGAEILFGSPSFALALGVTFFLFRMMNCVDGAVKFPARIKEMQEAGRQAWTQKDVSELARLIITALVSACFSICSTDAIYAAATVILGWIGVSSVTAAPYSYISSAIGAIGTLPMTLYWTHRGLKQLTFGDRSTTETKKDPTDAYTYFALLIVSTSVLGVLGSAITAGGNVFGRLGFFSECVRLFSSVMYAICAGTPGIATLLRASKTWDKKKCCIERVIHADREAGQSSYVPLPAS